MISAVAGEISVGWHAVQSRRAVTLDVYGTPLIDGRAHPAWLAKECPQDLYALAADPDVAAAWLDGVIEDCAIAKPAELRSMGGTF